MKQTGPSLFFCLTALLTFSAVQLNLSAALPAAAETDNQKRALFKAFRSRSQEKQADNVVYQDWKDGNRNRSLPVKLYMPKSGTAPYPVVIFSHGLGGSRDAATYLGDYWSQHGYFCIFVQHPGSDTEVWRNSAMGGRQAVLASLKPAANGQNLIDRANDIKFVIDELEKRNQTDSQLKGKLDLTHIAMSGHSFGAGTTLALAGQTWGARGQALLDKRISAAIYLCPPVTKGDPARNYGSIKIPGLLLTGTKDDSPINDTKASDRRIPYDNITAPGQYLVNFIGADHATFGGRAFRKPEATDTSFQQMIEKVSCEFLDAYLKGDGQAARWMKGKEISDYLNTNAEIERK